jgi:hypothetical protein
VSGLARCPSIVSARLSEFLLTNQASRESRRSPVPGVYPAGMPIPWAPANLKLSEREVLATMLQVEPDVATEHPRVLVIADEGFSGRAYERVLSGEHRITLPCSSRKVPRDHTPWRTAAQERAPLIESGQRHPQQPTRSRTARRAPSKVSPSASSSASWPWPPPAGSGPGGQSLTNCL